MPEFLTLIPPQAALDILIERLPTGSMGTEDIDSHSALGRILAEDIRSPHALPEFPRSTVDGYAIQAADSHGASDTLPAYLRIAGEVSMGSAPKFSLGPGEASLIYTGGMLPNGADAVVMIEHTQRTRENELEVLKPVARGENCLLVGEDVQTGQVVLAAGRRIGPAEIGGLMAIGLTRIQVARQPRVAILSSGDEVVEPAVRPGPGQVRDINSYSLSALVEQSGGLAVRIGVVADRLDDLRTAIRKGLDMSDCLVVTAGSSASTRDLTAQAISEMGSPGLLVHGVNVRPGKPTILAVCGSKPVIGLPGNPLSALVIARLFLIPVIDRLAGMTEWEPSPQIQARLATNLASQAGREDWIPVKINPAGKEITAEPVFFKSNFIFNLVQADGLVRIPPESNGLEAGTRVDVVLW